MRKQRGNMQLVIIVILLVGLMVGVYLVQQRTNILPNASSPSQTIQTDGDLMKIASDLDYENVDSLDQQLSQNDNDLNAF